MRRHCIVAMNLADQLIAFLNFFVASKMDTGLANLLLGNVVKPPVLNGVIENLGVYLIPIFLANIAEEPDNLQQIFVRNQTTPKPEALLHFVVSEARNHHRLRSQLSLLD